MSLSRSLFFSSRSKLPLLKSPLRNIYQKKIQLSITRLITIPNTKNKLCYSTFNVHSNTKNTNKNKKPINKINSIKLSLINKFKIITSFTFFSFVITAASITAIIVIYLILKELFWPSGDTQMFNRAAKLLENNKDVRNYLHCNDNNNYYFFNLFKKNEKIKSFGDLITNNKWARDRPITSFKKLNKFDNKIHYFMKFHLQTNKKLALVHLEAIDSDNFFNKPIFTTLYLDIPGEKRLYIIKPKNDNKSNIIKPRGILGLLSWRPSKD